MYILADPTDGLSGFASRTPISKNVFDPVNSIDEPVIDPIIAVFAIKSVAYDEVDAYDALTLGVLGAYDAVSAYDADVIDPSTLCAVVA